MAFNKTKTDPELGLKVHEYLVRKGVETPQNENSLSRTEKIDLIVLDEADEMLSQGFKDQIYKIFQYMHNDVQIGLFSATVPESLEQRLERAGEIFIRGFEDHSYMDKWASKAHNSVFTLGKQDFRDNLKLPNGNAWLFIFSYRYPNTEFTQKLDRILSQYPRNGRYDGYVGFGLGCIYATAKEVKG